MQSINPLATYQIWFYVFLMISFPILFVLYYLFVFSGFDFLLVIIAIIVLGILSFIWSYLLAKSWRYSVEDTPIKIERGVLAKRYTTIQFDKIQDVQIRRSIVSRLIGLSELYIQTAGSSNPRTYKGGPIFAEGWIPGLSIQEAEQISLEIINKMKTLKSTSF